MSWPGSKQTAWSHDLALSLRPPANAFASTTQPHPRTTALTPSKTKKQLYLPIYTFAITIISSSERVTVGGSIGATMLKSRPHCVTEEPSVQSWGWTRKFGKTLYIREISLGGTKWVPLGKLYIPDNLVVPPFLLFLGALYFFCFFFES